MASMSAGDDGAVLVTGARGAIGSWLIRELARRRVVVVGLDVAGEAVSRFPETATVPVIEGDLRDAALIREVIRDLGQGHAGRPHGRAVRIVHLAALVEAADRDPVAAIEVNALATARLLDAAAEAGVQRVVAMSTKGVMGQLPARYLHPTYEPVPVDLPPSPRSVYESTKHLVEIAARWHRRHGADVAVVRLATTWGPGKSAASHGAYSLHSEVVARAVRGERCRIDLHPDQGHDLIYYADVAAGLADLALSRRPLASPVYHLGSGKITTVGAFAAAVEAAFPGVRVETGGAFATGRSCLMDVSVARRDAAYEPAWDVPRALADIRTLAAAGIT
ncbi:MAG TPA: NAD(P)-dependent oxidoreductase [Candidatus Limnocylindrales bacterium]|nr:NAD(P)-dependent oxidoreductase [Candidatus Limnocylindrales bacterium]